MNYSWYTNNINENSPDAIHQTIAFGSLDDIKILKNKMGEKTMQELFLTHPKKVYTSASLNFIKNFIYFVILYIKKTNYL